VVAIHDGARPLAPADLFRTVIAVAAERGGAIPGRRLPAPTGNAAASGPLYTVQTPQAFRARPLLHAYERAARDGFVGTDTAACLERYEALEIAIVPGTPYNLKITFADDLTTAHHLTKT
jgi:2-C-methyl-D-erythritol 4-phosphate cytidylyltransferase